MKHPEVKHLYKYYAYNENSLSVLINKKIWVAKPESFNDPYDCDYNFSPNVDEKTLKEISKQTNSNIEDIKIATTETMKILKERFGNAGVFSMSEKNNSILMWSHYADQHKGFCIGFDRESDSILGKDDATKPVQYKNDYPYIEMFDQTGKMNEFFFEKMFFVKASDWVHEKEWRFVCSDGDSERQMPSNISSIIFGLKMPQKHRTTIKNILSGQGISYKVAEKVDKQFEIRIIDLPKK